MSRMLIKGQKFGVTSQGQSLLYWRCSSCGHWRLFHGIKYRVHHWIKNLLHLFWFKSISKYQLQHITVSVVKDFLQKLGRSIEKVGEMFRFNEGLQLFLVEFYFYMKKYNELIWFGIRLFCPIFFSFVIWVVAGQFIFIIGQFIYALYYPEILSKERIEPPCRRFRSLRHWHEQFNSFADWNLSSTV